MNKTKPPISDKDIIRTEVKRRIFLLNEEEQTEAMASLSKKLHSSSMIKKAQNIIGYQSLDDEIGIQLFLDSMSSKGKNIFIIDSSGNHPPLPTNGIILVPWRAFTISGKRIGRGWGWYDRFLREHPKFYSIGVCFGCQIFDDTPQDEWDIPMNTVCYSWPHTGQ